MRFALVTLLFAASCEFTEPVGTGGGGGGGTGTGGGGGTRPEYPSVVKLQGTIERTRRSWDSSGHLVFERTSKGSFSGKSTSQLLESTSLRYEFEQPFEVSGTQSRFDVTLGPQPCSLAISGSDQANVRLTVASPSTGGYVARFEGDVRTSTTGACTTGATVDNAFDFDLPGLGCPDSAVKMLAGQPWLVVAGDPHSGFQVVQDVSCDAGTIRFNASVDAL